MIENPVTVGHEKSPDGFKLSIGAVQLSSRGPAYPHGCIPALPLTFGQCFLFLTVKKEN
jgi:hypothetical protein